jgi:hypothetical protein
VYAAIARADGEAVGVGDALDGAVLSVPVDAAARRCPQAPQKRAVARNRAEHWGHRASSGWPHWSQKRFVEGFSV